MKGKVKWFNLRKRFGYITGEDGNEYFVHGSAVKNGRRYTGFDDDDEVEFDVTDGKKGPQAANVVMTSKPGKNDTSET